MPCEHILKNVTCLAKYVDASTDRHRLNVRTDYEMEIYCGTTFVTENMRGQKCDQVSRVYFLKVSRWSTFGRRFFTACGFRDF